MHRASWRTSSTDAQSRLILEQCHVRVDHDGRFDWKRWRWHLWFSVLLRGHWACQRLGEIFEKCYQISQTWCRALLCLIDSKDTRRLVLKHFHGRKSPRTPSKRHSRVWYAYQSWDSRTSCACWKLRGRSETIPNYSKDRCIPRQPPHNGDERGG